MNKERILDLAKFIEEHEELSFSMRNALPPTEYGTAGCISWFGHLWAKQFGREKSWQSLTEIHDREQSDLFNNLIMPEGWMTRSHLYPRERAVRALRHIAEGKVLSRDWREVPL